MQCSGVSFITLLVMEQYLAEANWLVRSQDPHVSTHTSAPPSARQGAADVWLFLPASPLPGGGVAAPVFLIAHGREAWRFGEAQAGYFLSFAVGWRQPLRARQQQDSPPHRGGSRVNAGPQRAYPPSPQKNPQPDAGFL